MKNIYIKNSKELNHITIPGLLKITDMKNSFIIKVEGNGMKNSGIKDGDFVMIERVNKLENGNIGAILYQGKQHLKTYKEMSDGSIELSYEDGITAPVIIPPNKEYKILGRLCCVLRRIKYND